MTPGLLIALSIVLAFAAGCVVGIRIGSEHTVKLIKPHVDDLVETLKTTTLIVDAHLDEARR